MYENVNAGPNNIRYLLLIYILLKKHLMLYYFIIFKLNNLQSNFSLLRDRQCYGQGREKYTVSLKRDTVRTVGTGRYDSGGKQIKIPYFIVELFCFLICTIILTILIVLIFILN